jgi:hypothetical protein
MTKRTTLTLFLLTGLVGCGSNSTSAPVSPATSAPIPPATSPPVIRPAAPVITEQDDAQAIVEKSIKAFGGPDKLARWNVGKVVYKVSGAATGFAGETTMEETFQYPRYFKRVAKTKLGDFVFVVNNGSSWSKKPNGSVSEKKSSVEQHTHKFC